MSFRMRDNFLTGEHYKKLSDLLGGMPMKYGDRSNHQADEFGHWSWKPFYDHRRNLADLTRNPTLNDPALHPIKQAWEQLRSMVEAEPLTNYKLIRCYSNGYTYGTDGYFHTDSNRKDELTAVLFICKSWEANWAGELILMNGAQYQAFLPWPNRLVVFDSSVWHCARAVSRICPVMRQVLVFKLRRERSANYEYQSEWLVNHGALSLSHQNGSLHDHLMRCFQRLVDEGADESTCRAGGLHSIYGTATFQPQLIKDGIDGRAEVDKAFGHEAERMAHLFHTLARPVTLDQRFPDGIPEYVKVCTRFGDEFLIDAPTFSRLQHIECVNLIDQNKLPNWPHLTEFHQQLKAKRDARVDVPVSQADRGADHPDGDAAQRLHRSDADDRAAGAGGAGP